MLSRFVMVASLIAAIPAFAQDVPGIEICTVEKKMDRRTSCLQSNVDFLVKTINKLRSDGDQKLDAAGRQIAVLRASVAELQKTVDELKAKATASTPATKDTPAADPAKGASATTGDKK